MSGSQTPRKLLKNRNDLVEAIEHLRPRGSYDPLPPPGGYPLPAYIKRKFSFAPQLPNVSLISLLPDFASSSLDLGVQLDESEAKKVTHETPTSLYVHYSLQSLRKTASERRAPPTLKPSLPKIDTTSPAVAEYEQSRKPNDNIYVVLSGSPQIQPARSLRRIHGRESLHISTTSSSKSDTCSTSPTLTSLTEYSAPSTPRTLLDLSDEEDHTVTDTYVQDGSDATSLCPRFDQRRFALVERLAQATSNLFGAFFIVDLQLLDKPARMTSHDMLPADLAPDEALYLDEANVDIPYELKTTFNGEQTIRTLPFEGDLVDCRATSIHPSHRFYGQIDLTNFLEKEFDDDVDIWLEIAYEEMEKAGIERRKGRPGGHPIPEASHPEAEHVSDVVKSLHQDYFVIGFSDMQKPGLGITMVSPTLATSKEMRRSDFLDWSGLRDRISTPQRFITRVHWQTPGRKDKLYCVPMFGPELVCWLCFLVDQDLPPIWPSSEKNIHHR
ncbi:MAG: hypothetical protein Q9225_002395 [Loekoesia sp. 1 TL-2023]